MPSPIQQIMFDLGVVLLHLDYERARDACVRLCDPKKLAEGGRFLSLLGRAPEVDAYERGDLSVQNLFNYFAESSGFRGSLQEFIEIWRGIFRENDPMIEFGRELEKRYPIYFMTNAGDIHVPWVFDRFPRLRFFRDVAASCYINAMKPEALFYTRALAKFNVSAESSLFIDDRPENIESARAAGFHCVLYQNPEQAIGETINLLEST
ncbi:MAG: HAD family phosphatase [Kiritimatiellae bacterium]|nr:HAD family phosphatase [Kiritimatiellia bacterium]